jgi:hypothetical protein
MTTPDSKSAERYESVLGHASTVVVVILGAAIAFFLFGPYSKEESPRDFVPMLGTVHLHYPMMVFSALLFLIMVAGCLVKKRSGDATAFLLLLMALPALLTPFAGWELLNTHLPAQRFERTVAITSVDAQDPDEAPDCTFAYYFSDSVGNEQFVCTEDTTPLKVGSKALIVENKNYFGVAILEFTPEPSSTAGATRAGH